MPSRLASPSKLSLPSFLKALYNSLSGQKNGKVIKHN